MTLTIQLFARARELAGSATITLDVPDGATVADVRHRLATDFPNLAPLLERSAIAVNRDFAEDSHALRPSDELAVIPPVSGG